MSLISSSRVYMTTMYIPRIVFGSSKTDTVFLLKRKTLFVLLSFLTLYHQHILCDLVVVFGSPCLIKMVSNSQIRFFRNLHVICPDTSMLLIVVAYILGKGDVISQIFRDSQVCLGLQPGYETTTPPPLVNLRIGSLLRPVSEARISLRMEFVGGFTLPN